MLAFLFADSIGVVSMALLSIVPNCGVFNIHINDGFFRHKRVNGFYYGRWPSGWRFFFYGISLARVFVRACPGDLRSEV